MSRFELTYSQTTDNEIYSAGTILSVTVLQNDGVSDENILLFERLGTEDIFRGICSHLDLLTYPAYAPTSGQGPFRKNTAEFTFASEMTCTLFINDLVIDIRALKESLDIFDELSVEETVTYPIEQASSSSSSGESCYISLTRLAVTTYPLVNPITYNFKVQATSGCADPNIFLHRNDVTGLNGNINTRYIGVITVNGFAEYGDAASNDVFPNFFRKNSMNISTRNLKDLYTGWQYIKINTLQLTQLLGKYNTVDADTTVTLV